MISVKVRIRLNLDLQHRLLHYQYQNYFFFNIWRGNLILYWPLCCWKRDIPRECRAPVQVSPFRGMTSRRDSSGPSTSVCIFFPFLKIFLSLFSILINCILCVSLTFFYLVLSFVYLCDGGRFVTEDVLWKVVPWRKTLWRRTFFVTENVCDLRTFCDRGRFWWEIHDWTFCNGGRFMMRKFCNEIK